jgi:hypothetical protein
LRLQGEDCDIFDVVQAKEKNYYDRHPTDQFLLLAIEVFGCLHKQVDVFLHNCVNTMWNLKRLEGPHLFILVIFIHQKISITLQRMQTFSILNWVVAISLITS